jgi:hypothetical protein
MIRTRRAALAQSGNRFSLRAFSDLIESEPRL